MFPYNDQEIINQQARILESFGTVNRDGARAWSLVNGMLGIPGVIGLSSGLVLTTNGIGGVSWQLESGGSATTLVPVGSVAGQILKSTGPGTAASWFLQPGSSYGGMWEAELTSPTQVVISAGGSPSGTFVQWTTGAASVFDTYGNVTKVGNTLVIGPNAGGVYRIGVEGCIGCPSASITIQVAVRQNGNIGGTGVPNKARCDILAAVSGSFTIVAIDTFLQLNPGDVIDLAFSASENITLSFNHMNLNLDMI